MDLLGLARRQSFRQSVTLCSPSGHDYVTIKLFFFQRTLDRDRSFGKNGLDQVYFLHAHIVSARIERTWTTSMQTAQDVTKCSEGNLQSDITLLSPAKNTDLGSRHGREDGVE